MFGLKGQRILHQHADNAAGECVRLHLSADPKEDFDATDFVPMNGCAQVQPRAGESAVQQQHREGNPGTVCQLCNFESVSDATTSRNRQASNAHLFGHGYIFLQPCLTLVPYSHCALSYYRTLMVTTCP